MKGKAGQKVSATIVTKDSETKISGVVAKWNRETALALQKKYKNDFDLSKHTPVILDDKSILRMNDEDVKMW